MTPHDERTSSEISKSILEELIHYDQWRDNLHVNDFPYTRNNIEKVIDAERQKTAGKREAVRQNISIIQKAISHGPLLKIQDSWAIQEALEKLKREFNLE